MRRLLTLVCLLVLCASPSWATITRVQTGITTHNGASNFTRATASNVTAGSLIVVSAARWKSGDAGPYVAGNLTKSAGTATIDTPVLHYAASPGSAHAVGLWSVLVTGSGTLTLQVANGGTAYGSIAVAEYSGTWDGTREEDTSSGTGTSTAADSGNATSAGAAVFVGSYTSDDGSDASITEDGAFTLLGEDQGSGARIHHSCIERIVATGTTDSASWTLGFSSAWVAGVVVFKEAAGGGGGGSAPRMMLLGVGP